MSFSWEFIIQTSEYVFRAIPMTLILTVFPAIAGLVIGFLLAVLKQRKIPVVNQIISIYLSFFRSVPLLVLLFLSYYGAPKLGNFLFHHGNRVLGTKNMDGNIVAIVVLVLYASAFLCEIIRGGISSVDKGQLEAAHALGFNGVQTYTRIVIPQAFLVVLPNYFNFILGLLKGTSVVFTISVVDIMAAAKIQAELGYRYIESYVLVGMIYILFSLVFSRLFLYLEDRIKVKMGRKAVPN